jgi:hypothetical protein
MDVRFGREVRFGKFHRIGNDKRASIEGSSHGTGFRIPEATPTSHYRLKRPFQDRKSIGLSPLTESRRLPTGYQPPENRTVRL